ncbi:o-succinylbenzoate--CoA ligase [Bacillus sp. CGMCC 1.16541]|uniref:o-succinylbenzoate--CoA ligase n=1 Tax=Bacillus sp. CGMCC 1.16541 TaxID=2185143 RepID=UPI000D72E6D5|nr:o-succinylbenzoate--CoA ligase [Bacillus sp. CGMCC 1.16541]
MTTIPNWLMKRACMTPDRVAIETDDEVVTFKNLHEQALSVAEQFTYHGVKKGDTVAVLMHNRLSMVYVIHALKYIGVQTVLLNTRLTSAEIAYQLEDSKATLLVYDDEFQRVVKESMLANQLSFVPISTLSESPKKAFDVVKEFSLDDADTIMYTSGTTGQPKGVIQTYGNHWWSAMGSALNLGLHENDCWLVAVPLFHISGLSILMRSVFYGMRVILHHQFYAQKVNEAIEKQGVTIVSVVTTMLTKMLDELGEHHYPQTFRCMLVGGGPAPLPVLRQCVEKKIPVYQTYGMTETASQVVTLAPEYSLAKLGSAGKALFPCEIQIVNDQGEIVESNKSGEIVVKGPNVTVGYLNNLEKTKATIQNGWLHTGDVGYLDEQGFLYVLDRRSDLIISGGENVYPAEIESVLRSHPAVSDAGVTAVSDEKWGQVPYGFVTLKTMITEQELTSYCASRLAKYKVPKKVFVVEALPRNASNKLVRRNLLSLVSEKSEYTRD